VHQGVVDFFVAPGSRSTPLAVAVSRHLKTHLHRHFDERGLGFYAMGCALAKEAPTAIITTSGTAVGNLLPSVMEAHHSSIPLLLLTADRPPELRDTSANQTTDQTKLFQNFVRFQFDLDPTMPEKAIRSKIAQAVFHSQYPHPGPVHINCPFREPLYPLEESKCNEGQSIRLETALFAPLPTQELPSKGIVLIGRLPKRSDLSAVLALAKKLQWPVFADLLSSARICPTPEQIIHFDFLFECAPKADAVLHFGERLTSKRLMEWLVTHPPSTYVHVSSHSHWNDPFQLVTHRIYASPGAVSYFVNSDDHWLRSWQELDRKIDSYFQSETSLFTETAMMKIIAKADLKEWGIFLANSMPIREAEWFLFPKNAFAFFANRGLAGIDGNIATIAGLARGIDKPILGIVGDVTTLHDLNSLPLLQHLPIVLIVSNNDGCGIFSHLAVATDPHFEKLWGFPHGYTFEEAAKLFRLNYAFANSEETFSLCLEQVIKEQKACILEVFTSRTTNLVEHKFWRQTCSHAMT
jgi:2-succinyl-5-enolpyruvyl-6-hydroxy-3-cyclohexene-1-carboxylate synthase